MKKSNLTVGMGVVVAAALVACGGGSGNEPATSAATTNPPNNTTPAAAVTMLRGVAASGSALANADIKICDANGSVLSTKSAADGSYSVDVSKLTAPLMISASTGAFVTMNSVAQPLNGITAYAALLDKLDSNTSNTANINPLTDKIASDVAGTDLKLKGTVQLINKCNASGVTAATIADATTKLRLLISDALKANSVAKPETFDPVKTPMTANHQGVDAVLDRLFHNRDGFSSGTSSELGGTNLFDANMQVLASNNVTLDGGAKPWSSYKTRIFVVGDSTASNYGKDVAPRNGWGQVFASYLKDGVDAKVVNLAQSGRSSRSFISEGWLKLLSSNIKAGDYVLIQFGHNDEKCDPASTTAAVDIAARCTYPNNASSKPQLTTNTAVLTAAGVTATEMSFQGSLEKYIKIAKDAGAIPVLITPVTRINQDKTVTSYVEGAFPIAKSTHITTKGDYFGNYSQTVIDTATANNVAIVDLDAKSIAFMNSIGVGTGGANATGGWRDYHLSVSDSVRYPYYAAQTTTGHYLNADRTHFQETGAKKVSELIIEGIKADTTRLATLIALLK